MRLFVEAEATRSSVNLGGWKHGLQVLAFIFGGAGVVEAAYFGVFSQNLEKRGRAAAVKTAKEDELATIRYGH